MRLLRLLSMTALGSAILALPTRGNSQELKWTHFGLRPLAMGNAFVSVADDYNALFYNPAGLARLKSWDGEFLNPYAEISAKTQSFIKSATKLAKGSQDSTKGTLNLIEEQTGNYQHLAIGMTPHLIFPNFGFGIGAEVAGTMVFHRYPSAYIDFGPRLIAPVSFAMNFLEDRLSVGGSVKFRLQGGINHEFSIQDIEAFKNDSKKEETNSKSSPKLEDYVEGGWGYGADFGLLFTPVKTMEPTLGLSVTDIGGTKFTKMDFSGNATAAPDLVLPSVNAGVSLKPIQSGRMYLLTAVEMHSLNHPVAFSKKLNLGLEWGYGYLIKIETGLHQGYLTGGMQFDVGLLRLALISYAEELGTTAGTVYDRRYAIQVKLVI